MIKLPILTLSFFFLIFSLNAQDFKENELIIPTAKDSIYGTLLTPFSIEKPNLVILIAGSGPTDRNGNQGNYSNNSLKYLAESLSENGIATYRYDKSILSILKKDDFNEESILFSRFIEDAKEMVTFFDNENTYSNIYVAGHSQGSLVGMMASKNIADGFISLAGPGTTIDHMLREQLIKGVPQLEESINTTLNKLKNGEKDTEFNPLLASVFRLSVQPFLIEWMQYDPQVEIKKLEIPVLIVNGTKDIQVAEKEAYILQKAYPTAQLVIIENMNHIFKEIKGETLENQLSYMNPDLPIMDELVTKIVSFIDLNK